ncbi:MAG: hypothetical protein IPK32_16865 [Verrucomicrobiaceae bacterium]|nr:hypothetical protein [Verrucomicrobiaceae bacterium]
MKKNQAHEWHESIPEGGKRYVRAYWDFRNWIWHYLIEPEMPAWAPLEHPTDEDWLMLRDLMFRKYQRKKYPLKYILMVDKILIEKGHTPSPAV